jgi:Flp pilus assembly protein TadD
VKVRGRRRQTSRLSQGDNRVKSAVKSRPRACRNASNQPRQAVAAFSEAISLQPNSAEARFQRGAAYLRLGDRRAALRECDEPRGVG